MKRLLIISNNVLSSTNNNGKTIYSFINGANTFEVSQLFFSGEKPRIKGFSYFRISDKDILNHLIFNKQCAGNIVIPNDVNDSSDDFSIRNAVGRNQFTLFAREAVWHNHWMSDRLIDWLDMNIPDAILFVAGDSLFAYDICSFIRNRYNARLTVYVTDDYVLPRSHESIIESFRRSIIKRKLSSILEIADCFYTISRPMQTEYKKLFQKDSHLALNMTDDLLIDNSNANIDEHLLIYAGSLYYGRAEVLGQLALALKTYNLKHDIKTKLIIYSNREPSQDVKDLICVPGASEYGGSLDSEQLKTEFNKAQYLVFVESFSPQFIEKVRYSLSTKVPEYMSLGKPIIAIGPESVGSIDYLKDVAFCIHNNSCEAVVDLLDNPELQKLLAAKAREKFELHHNKEKLQIDFIQEVFGEEI